VALLCPKVGAKTKKKTTVEFTEGKQTLIRSGEEKGPEMRVEKSLLEARKDAHVTSGEEADHHG